MLWVQTCFKIPPRPGSSHLLPTPQTHPDTKILSSISQTYEVAESNITPVQYGAVSGTGEFPGLPQGKAVVSRTVNPDGTSTIELYIQADNPVWTQNYNSQCNPAKRKRDGGSCAAAPSGSTTTAPAKPALSCEYIGPSPPEQPEAQCACDGTSNLPLTTRSTQLPPESSCAWSTIPGATSATGSAPLGPPTTNSQACHVCTRYAVNEDSCTSIPNCLKELAQATVHAGSSPVRVGTLTSTALSSAISSALDQICPSVTGTAAIGCQTKSIDIEHIDYKDFEGVINHSGSLSVQVQYSSYNDSGIRKAMIESAALTAMNGATGKNCYQDTPVMEPVKRSLFARALSYVPESFVPKTLLPRLGGEGPPIEEHVTWCNTVSFAGVQYYGEFARLAQTLGTTDELDAEWTFHEDSGDAFDCEFLGELIDGLAALAPEFVGEDVALGEEIQATCEAVMQATGGSKAKREALESDSSPVDRRGLQGIEGPMPKPRPFMA